MSTTTNTAARNAIDAAIEALMTRRGQRRANEKATINNSIIELQDQRDALDGADLDAAARAVASATAALGDSVAAARVGPFDSYLAAMHTAIGTLQNVHADAHASIRLPRTMVQLPTHLQQPRWLHQRWHPSPCHQSGRELTPRLWPVNTWLASMPVSPLPTSCRRSHGRATMLSSHAARTPMLGPVLAFPGILLAYSTAWNAASTSARICTTAIRSWRAP